MKIEIPEKEGFEIVSYEIGEGIKEKETNNVTYMVNVEYEKERELKRVSYYWIKIKQRGDYEVALYSYGYFYCIGLMERIPKEEVHMIGNEINIKPLVSNGL